MIFGWDFDLRLSLGAAFYILSEFSCKSRNKEKELVVSTKIGIHLCLRQEALRVGPGDEPRDDTFGFDFVRGPTLPSPFRHLTMAPSLSPEGRGKGGSLLLTFPAPGQGRR